MADQNSFRLFFSLPRCLNTSSYYICAMLSKAVDKLSNDILYIIFDYAYPNKDITGAQFKKRLALLSICQQWKHAALPMVCKNLYIVYNDKVVELTGCTRGDEVFCTLKAHIDSNAYLLGKSLYRDMVRHAYINVRYVECPLTGLKEVIALLNSYATWWPVQSIKLEVYKQRFDIGVLEENSNQMEYECSHVVSSFASVFPCVTKAKLHSLTQCAIINKLCNSLIARYSAQLQRIDCNHLIEPTAETKLTSLKYFKTSFTRGIAGKECWVSPQYLTSLHLTVTFNGNPWKAFTIGSLNNVIEFSNLETLKMVYITTGSNPTRHTDIQLKFPRLRNLYIRDNGDQCPLIKLAEFPPSMDIISFSVPLLGLNALKQAVLPVSKEFVLNVDMNIGVTEMNVVNYMLKRLHGSCRVRLVFAGNIFNMQPESLVCKNLVYLRLHDRGNIDWVYTFVNQHPNLQELILSCIVNSARSSIDNTSTRVISSAELPLQAKLQRLELNYTSNVSCQDASVTDVQTLLLRIPSITTLIAKQIPRKPVADFVSQYTPQFLHLATIKLELSDLICL